MVRLKSVAVSLVVVAAFEAAACMAQQHANPSPAAALPIPKASQITRCGDIGRFAKDVATARESGESRQHYVGRLGLAMFPPKGLGLIHQRLPTHTRYPGGPELVQRIYDSKQSPVAWQLATLDACERTIS